jgi:hypothetical protein
MSARYRVHSGVRVISYHTSRLGALWQSKRNDGWVPEERTDGRGWVPIPVCSEADRRWREQAKRENFEAFVNAAFPQESEEIYD